MFSHVSASFHIPYFVRLYDFMALAAALSIISARRVSSYHQVMSIEQDNPIEEAALAADCPACERLQAEGLLAETE